MIRFKSTTTAVLSENITKIYQKKIWKFMEYYKQFLVTGDLNFALKFIKDLIKALGTKITLSIAYHPQTDSQTE